MKTLAVPPVGAAAGVMDRVRDLLDLGQPENALEALNACGLSTPAARNARGVCLLRLGRYDMAAKVFRDLVFPDGAFSIPEETPTVFRANYVTALLLLDNVVVGLDLLREIPDKQHPAVQQLKTALRQWKQSLPWWRRALLPLGWYPAGSLRLDFAPGAIWVPTAQDAPRPVERAA